MAVSLFDKHLLHPADLTEPEVPYGFLLARKDYDPIFEERVVRIYVRGILGGLLDCVHLLLARLLVHRTYHNRLPEGNIARRCELCLSLLVTSRKWTMYLP